MEDIFRLIRNRNIYGIRELIKPGANLEIKNSDHETPLLHLITNNIKRLDIVNLLLDNGADVNAKDITGFTPFMWSIHKGDIVLAELLFSKGVSFDYEKKRVLRDLAININKYSSDAARWNKMLNIINGTKYGRGRNV